MQNVRRRKGSVVPRQYVRCAIAFLALLIYFCVYSIYTPAPYIPMRIPIPGDDVIVVTLTRPNETPRHRSGNVVAVQWGDKPAVLWNGRPVPYFAPAKPPPPLPSAARKWDGQRIDFINIVSMLLGLNEPLLSADRAAAEAASVHEDAHDPEASRDTVTEQPPFCTAAAAKTLLLSALDNITYASPQYRTLAHRDDTHSDAGADTSPLSADESACLQAHARRAVGFLIKEHDFWPCLPVGGILRIMRTLQLLNTPLVLGYGFGLVYLPRRKAVDAVRTWVKYSTLTDRTLPVDSALTEIRARNVHPVLAVHHPLIAPNRENLNHHVCDSRCFTFCRDAGHKARYGTPTVVIPDAVLRSVGAAAEHGCKEFRCNWASDAASVAKLSNRSLEAHFRRGKAAASGEHAQRETCCTRTTLSSRVEPLYFVD
eukprot:TRINITY_DN1862_c0_g1_i1.p1 TRINITY_DN1862_c0_g1~~TRINITY_DN1862_c0_g1_i1.p1  ORF type:complete len:427 (+),score=40.86 TRINITY_DN1862_c0_g1_i1:110-1390(+)